MPWRQNSIPRGTQIAFECLAPALFKKIESCFVLNDEFKERGTGQIPNQP